MKLLCIDGRDKDNCIKRGLIKPLVEGEIYTLRGTTDTDGRLGYLLVEIINRCNVRGYPGMEASYAPKRFIPLSDIDETISLTKEEPAFV